MVISTNHMLKIWVALSPGLWVVTQVRYNYHSTAWELYLSICFKGHFFTAFHPRTKAVNMAVWPEMWFKWDSTRLSVTPPERLVCLFHVYLFSDLTAFDLNNDGLMARPTSRKRSPLTIGNFLLFTDFFTYFQFILYAVKKVYWINLNRKWQIGEERPNWVKLRLTNHNLRMRDSFSVLLRPRSV